MAILNVNQLEMRYPSGWSLGPISFNVSKGSCLGVIGPNGSGKSTLLKGVARLADVSSGSVSWNEKKSSQYTIEEWVRQVAWVGADNAFDFSFTVEEVVAMGTGHSRCDQGRLAYTLKWMELSELQHRNIQCLSSGERQRVWLARAFVQNPKLLIMDEPQAHLDIGQSWKLFDKLRTWQQERNLTVIVALHDLNLAAAFCDQLLLIKEGRSVTDAPISPTELQSYLPQLFDVPIHTKLTKEFMYEK